MDLGALWRARRWRRLLNFIDHLPRNSHFSQAVASDEEHAKLLLEATKDKPADGYAPPMSQWSQEAELMATLVDEIRGLRYITLAVNSKAKPKPPMPYPRPRTALEVVRRRSREEKHKALVARVLPHKS